jgi:pheromone shutdown protein TraB
VLQEAVDLGLLVQPLPDIYVLGTVHAGNQSAIEVQALLETVQPRTVVLEVSPSRLALLRHRRRRNQQNQSSMTRSTFEDTSASSLSLSQALMTWPAIWTQGWEKGGWPAAFFGMIIVWPALVSTASQRLFLTSFSSQASTQRVDEFVTAVRVVDDLHKGTAKVVAADVEMETIWKQVGVALARPSDCVALVGRLLGEAVGDPLSRRSDESYQDWCTRRRQPATARASKQHGMGRSPALADVLVDQRDKTLADALIHHVDQTPVVCVVGLVHLEGVVQRLVHQNNSKSQ